MKAIKLSGIVPGSIAQCDHFGPNGELLVAEGAVITDRHIAVLQRRNIEQLFVQSGPEEGRADHCEKRLKELETFDLEAESTDHAGPDEKPLPPPTEDLLTLLESAPVQALDDRLGEVGEEDGPSGTALNRSEKQITPADRTVEYKSQILLSYKDALGSTVRILNRLADGASVCVAEVRAIVETFVEVFISDRNILLNISATRPEGEDYIYNHSLNVCLLSINIAASYGYNKNQVVEIGMGALLHDVGMLRIPKRIRCSEKQLSRDDWYEVQKHPVLSLHLLERVNGLPESVGFIAYQIHERVNAKGYPKHRGDRLIHRYAKLVQVADVYEAMTMPRPHRKPQMPYTAMENLIKMAKFGLVSDEFVRAFIIYASLFPVGSLVQLSDKRIAKVIHANGSEYTRPTVSVLTETNGSVVPSSEIVQLDLRTSAVGILRPLPFDCLPDSDLMSGF